MKRWFWYYGSYPYSEYIKIDTIISGLVSNNPEIIKFKRNMEETILIFKGEMPDIMEETAYGMAQAIKYEVERNTESLISVSVGSIRERINGISKSFKDADTAKKYMYIFGKNKIIGIKDIKADGFSQKGLLKLEKNRVFDFLKTGSRSELPAFMESHLSVLDEYGMNSSIYTYYVCMDMILDMARFVEELDGNIETLSPEILDVETLLNNMASKEQFAESIKKIILNILNFRDSKIVSRYENTIRKAKGFIDSNYPDPNLSLNNVAEHVNVSPSHFSTIFSQETGETFIEYLTRVRMKKAMEFLRTTTLKSSEIGYKVGYSDPHYFSYLFKKTTGVTPKEFRNG